MSIRTPKAIRYDLPIKELGKTIPFRALKVGEQKTLLTAIEMKDAKALVNVILDIVTECTFKEVDLSKLPMHLVDFIFLHIYMKSGGSMAKAEFSCAGELEQPVKDENDQPTEEMAVQACGQRLIMNIDLSRTTIKYPDDYKSSTVLDVGDGMVVKIRLPSFEAFKKMEADKDWMDIADQFIFSGIECIQDGDEIKVPGVDFTQEELVEWLNTLDSSVTEKINTFFNEAPTLFLQVPVTCPKCGRKEDFELNTLEDFFG